MFEVLRLITQGGVERGHKVAVAYGVRSETPSDPRPHLHPDVDLFPTRWRRRSMTANLRACADVRRTVALWCPDIIHLHSSFAGLVGAITLPDDIPVVYTPHAFSFEMSSQPLYWRRMFRMLEAYVCRRVELVAGVSRDEARLAREVLRAPRVIAVPNGIPELDRPVVPRLSRRQPPLTAAMGRIAPQRQPAACARILAAIGAETEAVWIGGAATPDSGDADRLRQADVSVTGWIPRQEAMRRLGEADVYLHWTAWDGFPLSVLEAMARDVMVVAHDIPPLREILDRRQLCASEDEAAALIRRAIADPVFMQDVLGIQRERARAFGAGRMLAKWADLYDRISAS